MTNKEINLPYIILSGEIPAAGESSTMQMTYCNNGQVLKCDVTATRTEPAKEYRRKNYKVNMEGDKL